MPYVPPDTLAAPTPQRNRISSRPRLPASLKPNPTLSLKHSMSAATLRVKHLLTSEELEDRQKLDELQATLRAHAEHKRRVYDYVMSVKFKKQQEEGGELEIDEEEKVDNDMAEKILEVLDMLDRMQAASDQRLLQQANMSTPATTGAVFSRPMIVKRFPAPIQNNELKAEAGEHGSQDQISIENTPTKSGIDVEVKSNISTPKPGYDEDGVPLLFKLPAWKAMMGEYSPTVKPSTAQVESATASSATAPAATSAAATSAAGASTSAAVEEEPQYIFTREQLIEFANGPPKPPKYPRPDDLSPYYQPVTLHPSRANDPLSLSLKDMADKIGMVLIDHNITREMERREGIIRRDPAKELIESSRSNSVTSIQSRDQCLTEGSSDTKQCGPLETKQSGSHASESEKSLSKTDASIPLHKEQSPEPTKDDSATGTPESIFGNADYHKLLMTAKANGRFNSAEMKEYIRYQREQAMLEQEMTKLAPKKSTSTLNSESTDSETMKKPKTTFHSAENLQKRSTPPKIMATVKEMDETESSDYPSDEPNKSGATSEIEERLSGSNKENDKKKLSAILANTQKSRLSVPGGDYMTNLVTRRNNPFKTPLRERSTEASGAEDDGSVYSRPSGWGSRQAKRGEDDEEDFAGLDSDSDEDSEESQVPSTSSEVRKRPKEFQLLGFSMEDVFLDQETGAFKHPDRTIGGVGDLCRRYGPLAWEMYQNGELVFTPKPKVEPKGEEESENTKLSKRPLFGRNPTSNIFSIARKPSSSTIEKPKQRDSIDNQNEQDNKNGLGAGMRRIFGSNFGARASKDGLQASGSVEGFYGNPKNTNRLSGDSNHTANGTDPSLQKNLSNEANNNQGNLRVFSNNVGPRPLPSLPVLRPSTNDQKTQKTSRIPAWPLGKLSSGTVQANSGRAEPVPPVVLAPPSKSTYKQTSRVPLPTSGFLLMRPQSGAGSRPPSRAGGTRPLSRSGSRASNRPPSRGAGRRGSGSNSRPSSRTGSIRRMGALRNPPTQKPTTKPSITRTKGVANLRMLDNKQQAQSKISHDGNRPESRLSSTVEKSRIPAPQGGLRSSFGFLNRSKQSQSSNQQFTGPYLGYQTNGQHSEQQVKEIGNHIPTPQLPNDSEDRHSKPKRRRNYWDRLPPARGPSGEIIFEDQESFQADDCSHYSDQ